MRRKVETRFPSTLGLLNVDSFWLQKVSVVCVFKVHENKFTPWANNQEPNAHVRAPQATEVSIKQENTADAEASTEPSDLLVDGYDDGTQPAEVDHEDLFYWLQNEFQKDGMKEENQDEELQETEKTELELDKNTKFESTPTSPAPVKEKTHSSDDENQYAEAKSPQCTDRRKQPRSRRRSRSRSHQKQSRRSRRSSSRRHSRMRTRRRSTSSSRSASSRSAKYWKRYLGFAYFFWG